MSGEARVSLDLTHVLCTFMFLARLRIIQYLLFSRRFQLPCFLGTCINYTESYPAYGMFRIDSRRRKLILEYMSRRMLRLLCKRASFCFSTCGVVNFFAKH